MTVNIIKRGTPPREKIYAITCYKCKSEFTFQSDDATYNSDQRDGDYFSIYCPVCTTLCTKSANENKYQYDSYGR